MKDQAWLEKRLGEAHLKHIEVCDALSAMLKGERPMGFLGMDWFNLCADGIKAETEINLLNIILENKEGI